MADEPGLVEAVTEDRVSLHLAVYRSDRLIRRYRVARSTVTIGADPRADVRLHDKTAAPTHAVIEVVSPDCITFVHRDGSEVRVNGQIVRECDLLEGDEIEIEGTKIVVERATREAAPEQELPGNASTPNPAPRAAPDHPAKADAGHEGGGANEDRRKLVVAQSAAANAPASLVQVAASGSRPRNEQEFARWQRLQLDDAKIVACVIVRQLNESLQFPRLYEAMNAALAPPPVAKCSSCGVAAQPNQRFCESCGAATGDAQGSSEAKRDIEFALKFIGTDLSELSRDYQAPAFEPNFQVFASLVAGCLQQVRTRIPRAAPLFKGMEFGADQRARYCEEIASSLRRECGNAVAQMSAQQARARAGKAALEAADKLDVGSLLVSAGLGVISVFNPLALVPLAGKLFAEKTRGEQMRRQVADAFEALVAARRWADEAHAGMDRALEGIRSSTETKYRNFADLVFRGLAESGVAQEVDWTQMCSAHLRESAHGLRKMCERYPGLKNQLVALGLDQEVEGLIARDEVTLAVLLARQGPLTPENAKVLLTGVCQALRSIHNRGAVHRDVRPENVVVLSGSEPEFVALLDTPITGRQVISEEGPLDFEESKSLIMARAPYMSPEEFTGQPSDARSDLYSLGVVAFEMLTGRLPFEHDALTIWDWANVHVAQPPIPIDSLRVTLSSRTCAAVMKGLAKSPDDRFRTAQAFVAAL
jgi:Protein kinase domain